MTQYLRRLNWPFVLMVLAFGLFVFMATLAAQAQNVPYYYRTLLNQTTGTITINGLQGQGTCSFAITSVPSSSTVTVTQGSLSTQVGGSSTPVIFYDANGNPAGTSFSTTTSVSFWFNCSNAISVSLAVTAGTAYNATFIGTAQAWPYGTIPNHVGSIVSSVPSNYADYWPDSGAYAHSASIVAPGTTVLLTGAVGLRWYIFYMGCVAGGALTTPTCNIETGTTGACTTSPNPVFPQAVPGPTTAAASIPLYGGSAVGNGIVPADKPLAIASPLSVCAVSAGTLTNGLQYQWLAVQGP